MTAKRTSSNRIPGCYLLLLRLPRAVALEYGTRRSRLANGYYVYCGSAQGGLQARVPRHLRANRGKHWHIDRLLDHARVIDVQIRVSLQREDECMLARQVSSWPEAKPIIGFGAGDCRCPTHLYFFPKRPLVSIRMEEVVRYLPNIYQYLRRHYPPQPMWHRSPFQILTGCILSLRTQDPVTEKAMARLFAAYPDAQAIAAARPEDMAGLIYPVGMYNQKSLTLKAIASQIIERHNGEVPAEIEDLLRLPGVGLKTASLVRSFAYRLPAICVDTHVHRIANRWGLVRTAVPDQTETELRRVLPQKYWIETNSQLVQHGQRLCRPSHPKCPQCGLRQYCGWQDLEREQAIMN